ncbi:aryl-alcohol dehydrogenase [Podospora australis]|uniref:Aryl-alcohol dehydrogenase n=1 Tax=Podospora australis TaxID=1536484 RepID=A0AAN6WV52_9PEZI|nr:aryl-alcohol dehydrogenase [Podospora australis]
MAGFAGPPMPLDPPTELGRLRILFRTAGIRVSRFALGGGNIGEAWNDSWNVQTKERAFEVLDAYLAAGGNFIDTANTYQDGQSETWIGEWMVDRKVRDRMVVSTKYSSDVGMYDFQNPGMMKGMTANHGGNSRRSLHHSVQSSLRRLQTDWIDILYLHWWDYTTSIEEVVDSLNVLVQQGKVLYLGISDTPAWVVSAANTYAKAHGKVGFSVYSGKWSVLARDLEREILPMIKTFGMALTPWGTLGGGMFQSKKEVEDREKAGETLRQFGSGRQVEISDALEKVAEQQGVESKATSIALAYIWRKAELCGIYNVFPVVGMRKVEQLKDNIAALDIKLTKEQVEYLESVKEFDIGWPHDFIGRDPSIIGTMGWMSSGSAYISFAEADRK